MAIVEDIILLSSYLIILVPLLGSVILFPALFLVGLVYFFPAWWKRRYGTRLRSGIPLLTVCASVIPFLVLFVVPVLSGVQRGCDEYNISEPEIFLESVARGIEKYREVILPVMAFVSAIGFAIGVFASFKIVPKEDRRSRQFFKIYVVTFVLAFASWLLLVSSNNNYHAPSRDTRRAAVLASVTAALELYNDRYAYYPLFSGPDTAANFFEMVRLLRSEGFLGSAPQDPMGGEYAYRYAAEGDIDGITGELCVPSNAAYIMQARFDCPARTKLDNNDGNCSEYRADGGAVISCEEPGEYCVYQVK